MSADPGNPTYEWLQSNKLEFIAPHIDDWTIDNFRNLTEDELKEFMKETPGINKLSLRQQLRFKSCVRQLRSSSSSEIIIAKKNSNTNYNYNLLSNPSDDENRIDDSSAATNTPKQNDSVAIGGGDIKNMSLNKMDLNNHKRKADHVAKDCHYKINIKIIGAHRVGKTSIINQFINERFDYDTQSTIGCDFFSTVVWLANDERVFLKIWDTAGEEQYDSENGRLLKDADCIIIVYDITNKKSYNLIEEKYKKMIDEHCAKDNVYIMIVGNKHDLRKGENNKGNNGNNDNKDKEEKNGQERVDFIPQQVVKDMIKRHQTQKRGRGTDPTKYRWGFSELTAKHNDSIRQLFQTCCEYSVSKATKNIDYKEVVDVTRQQMEGPDEKNGCCW